MSLSSGVRTPPSIRGGRNKPTSSSSADIRHSNHIMGYQPLAADLKMLRSMQTAGCRAAAAVAAGPVIPLERHSAVHLSPQSTPERLTLPFQREISFNHITLPRCPREDMCSTVWPHIEGLLLPGQPVASVPLPHPMAGVRLRDTEAKRMDPNTYPTGTATCQPMIRVGMKCRIASRHMWILATHGNPLTTAGCLEAMHIVRAAQAAVIKLDGKTGPAAR